MERSYRFPLNFASKQIIDQDFYWPSSYYMLKSTLMKENFPNLLQIISLKSVYKWMSLYKCPLYDHSWPFFRHLSQNWGSDGHFEVLNRSYLWLVEKLWRKTQIFPFLFLIAILYKNRYLHFFVFYVFVFFVITFVPIKI